MLSHSCVKDGDHTTEIVFLSHSVWSELSHYIAWVIRIVPRGLLEWSELPQIRFDDSGLVFLAILGVRSMLRKVQLHGGIFTGPTVDVMGFPAVCLFTMLRVKPVCRNMGENTKKRPAVLPSWSELPHPKTQVIWITPDGGIRINLDSFLSRCSILFHEASPFGDSFTRM